MGGRAGNDNEPGERAAIVHELLHNRAFCALLIAEVQSTVGDQLARVALSVLVFQRTGSATATALTYAATFLPAVLGGALLAGIGDRFPRPVVMVGADLLRCALFVAMAVPGLGIGPIAALLVVAVFIGPVFTASEVSYLSTLLTPPVFGTSAGIRLTSNQVAQVVGFAAGGLVVAAMGPRPALLVNAATFLASALLIGALVRETRRQHRGGARNAAISLRAAAWFGRHREAGALLILSSLAGFFVVPEGLAVPFGHERGASTTVIGLLFAALPLGSAVGAIVLVRAVPLARRRVVSGWMAMGCGLPLVVSAVALPWPVAFGCWFLTGALAAYQVEVITTIAHGTPLADRTKLMGIASACLIGAQGLGLIVFGAVARFISTPVAIGLAGLAGSAAAVIVIASALRPWLRGTESLPSLRSMSDADAR